MSARTRPFKADPRVPSVRPKPAPLLAGGVAAWLSATAAAQPQPPAGPPDEPPATLSIPTVDPQESDGQRHRVSSFVFKYLRELPGQPPADQLLDAVVRVSPTTTGFVAPREGGPVVSIRLGDLATTEVPGFFYDSALPLIAPAVVERLQALGLIGVYVEPDPAEIGVENGRIVDRRPIQQRWLTLQITTGVVAQVRTVGLGERLPEDQTVNNPVHEKIRTGSPVQPGDDSTAPSLIQRDAIDDYVFQKNRHPGRRVDVAVAPEGTEPGGVTVDYLVTENRPWMLYGQVSNTGTEGTSDWRERFGFIHNQLTNNDDILTIDFLTANFDEVYSLTGAYERPFGGYDRLRWRAAGSWYTYTASDVGQPNANFDGEGWTAGGDLVWNFYQDRDFFLDLAAGFRWENINTDNKLAGVDGDENFFLPHVGVRMERVRETEQTLGGLNVEWNMPGIAGTDPDTIDELGRLDADDSWATLQWDIAHSFYLEPLFQKDRAKPSSLAHELALSARGQFAFGARLVPNAEETLGGLYSIRGYPESIVAGDTVYSGTIEYRFHLPQGLTPSAQPGQLFGTPFRYSPQYLSGPTDWDLIFKAFCDIGRTVNSDRQSYERDQTLVGAGVGMELVLTRRLTLRVDWGFALNGLDDANGESLVDEGDQEVHFVATVIF